jgi:hypothetical protein
MIIPVTDEITPMPVPQTTPEISALPQVPAEKNTLLTNSLAGLVRGHFEKAKNERVSSGVEEKMIWAKLARALEYDAKKRMEIAIMHGKDYDPPFMPVIETKCRAYEDRIMDVYFQAGTKPFGIENTPDPEMPPEIEETVKAVYGQEIATQIAEQMIQSGIQDIDAIDQAITQEMERRSKIIHLKIKETAKDITAKLENKVNDGLTEGGWYNAVKEVIHDIVTFPAAFLVGPEEHKVIKRSRSWNPATNRYVTTYDEVVQEKFRRPSPVNIYPLVGSRTPQDGIIEKVQFSPIELQNMIGVDGFDEDEIRLVLQESQGGGLKEWTTIDSRLANLDNKSTNGVVTGDNIDGIIFWGAAPGSHLIQWGINRKGEVVTDADKWYRVYCILIGNHVIMARLNPNPDGLVPYYKASFVDDPDKFWNVSLPDILKSHQITANAVFRACGMNAALASQPIFEQDSDRITDDRPIAPGMRIKSTGSQMATGRALNMYNIPLVVGPLSQFYNFLMETADFDSGLNRMSHGGEAPQGIDTAAGQQMAFASSGVGVKAIIGHIDKGITEPSVKAEYYYIVDNDESVKHPVGDVAIVSKGTSALVQRERSTQQMKEALMATNNPTDMQIIGMEGRRQMLRDSMKGLPMDIDKILPEEMDMIEQFKNGQGGQPQLGAPMEPMSGAPMEPEMGMPEMEEVMA